MYNDYARPWRRFPCVLMLLLVIALSAASCRTTQKQTAEEYSHEETSDTMAVTATETQRRELALAFTALNSSETLHWHLLAYDTALPVNSQTGRPPVKAEAFATATRRREEQEKATALVTETLRTVTVSAAGSSQSNRAS